MYMYVRACVRVYAHVWLHGDSSVGGGDCSGERRRPARLSISLSPSCMHLQRQGGFNALAQKQGNIETDGVAPAPASQYSTRSAHARRTPRARSGCPALASDALCSHRRHCATDFSRSQAHARATRPAQWLEWMLCCALRLDLGTLRIPQLHLAIPVYIHCLWLRPVLHTPPPRVGHHPAPVRIRSAGPHALRLDARARGTRGTRGTRTSPLHPVTSSYIQLHPQKSRSCSTTPPTRPRMHVLRLCVLLNMLAVQHLSLLTPPPHLRCAVLCAVRHTLCHPLRWQELRAGTSANSTEDTAKDAR